MLWATFLPLRCRVCCTAHPRVVTGYRSAKLASSIYMLRLPKAWVCVFRARCSRAGVSLSPLVLQRPSCGEGERFLVLCSRNRIGPRLACLLFECVCVCKQSSFRGLFFIFVAFYAGFGGIRSPVFVLRCTLLRCLFLPLFFRRAMIALSAGVGP